MCVSVLAEPEDRVPGCAACDCLNLLDADLLPVVVVVPHPDGGFALWLQEFLIPDMDGYEAFSERDRAVIAAYLCRAAMQNYAVGHP